jgi:hypothetical protein
MTTSLVNAFPSWLLAIVIVAVCVTVALVASRILARVFRGHVRPDHSEVAGDVLQAWGAMYAVLLALVVIALWDRRSEVDAHATEEAGFLIATYRDAGGLPPAFREDAHAKIEAYVHAVIERSYPALRVGTPSDETRTTFGDMFTTIRSFRPADLHDEILYGEALRELNQSSEARTKRLAAVRGGLPPVFWAVLLVTTAITLAAVGALQMEGGRVRDCFVAGFACGVGSLIFLVVVLDRPFSGDLALTPDPYLEALDAMKAAR